MRWDRRTLLRAGASCLALPALSCATAPRPADDRYASLRGFTADAKPLTAEHHAKHVARARELVRGAGLTALVVEAGRTLWYLSGVRWGLSERPFLMIVPAEGSPRWVAPAFEALRARESIGDAELLVWQEDEDPYALAKKAIGTGRVAVAPQMRDFVVRGLRGAVGEVESGAAIVEALRTIKGPDELALLERANLATKAALRIARDATRVGMSEGEMRTIITEAQQAAGLVHVWALVLFGENAAFPHGTGRERTLAEGDLVLIDTGGQLHGYCSDITRTWPCGNATPDAKRALETVLAAQSAAFEVLAPGTPCADADAAARKVIADAGFGEDYAAFTHRLGHGIGLDGHEAPYLVRGNTTILRPGMTMSNEPGIYRPGAFGVRIEDILAITADGHRVFGERATVG